MDVREGPSVVFFTQGVNVPSSRFRVGQFLPHFEAAGVRSTLLPARPSTQGDVPWRWAHGRRRALFKPLSIVSRLIDLPKIRNHDVVFLQRPLLKYYTTILEKIVTTFKRTILDFDDAIFNNLLGLESWRLRRIIELVDHVIVGNQHLYDFVDEPRKTTIIPTVVDTRRYQMRPDPVGRFTLGWTGVSSNLKELRLIAKPLRRVLAATGGELLIISDRISESWLRELPLRFVRWSPTVEAEALAAVHVGLMPLKHTHYNEGKCGFKLIQYMARGIPAVATPIGANKQIVRHGIDGFLADSDRAWEEALLELWRSGDVRRAMGERARVRVESDYSIDAVDERRHTQG
ncbi:MAG: glycosyltransferase family 4 protein [Deltaproteobacteria bacterium]|nr:glycosyltransferase family 4 protein [Deltaproteobacteria bacterium]